MSVIAAPTVYGIETRFLLLLLDMLTQVATAPTVYGIETLPLEFFRLIR